jgi:rSAM/selenodomain-associated transferase 1
VTNRTPGSVGIGVFGRIPHPGVGKTRLAAGLGVERAAAFAAAFLGDTLGRASLVSPGATWWWIAPEDARGEADLVAAAAATGLVPAGVRLAVQRGAHLGERMADALASMLADGPALLIGSDVPDVPIAALERAASLLTGPAAEDDGAAPAPRLVLGPALDGGFYLVGCTAPPGPLLAARAQWGDATVLARTQEDARRNGWRVEWLEAGSDVDTAADLDALARRLEAARHDGAATRPGWPARTAALLRAEDQGAAGAPVGG